MTRAHFNLAIALTGQARLAEAESAYRSVIAGDPAYRGVWLNLGNLLVDQNKLDEAVVAYRRALAVNADDPGSLGNLPSLARSVTKATTADRCSAGT